MNELEMKHLFEAALLAAGRPITTEQLAELFDERERPSTEQILTALNELQGDYVGRGLELREVSSGWRVQVRDNCIEFVSRLWQERPARYSRALLETLALIAYRQPITRGEIEEIRGVAVSSTIMRTLYDRNWIRVVGHREVPGRPEVLATTREFLDYFGLKSLDDLPTLAELKDVETIGVQLDFAAPVNATLGDDPQMDIEMVTGQPNAESTLSDGSTHAAAVDAPAVTDAADASIESASTTQIAADEVVAAPAFAADTDATSMAAAEADLAAAVDESRA